MMEECPYDEEEDHLSSVRSNLLLQEQGLKHLGKARVTQTWHGPKDDPCVIRKGRIVTVVSALVVNRKVRILCLAGKEIVYIPRSILESVEERKS